MKKFCLSLLLVLDLFQFAIFPRGIQAEDCCHLGGNELNKSDKVLASEREERVEHYSNFRAWSGLWLPLSRNISEDSEDKSAVESTVEATEKPAQSLEGEVATISDYRMFKIAGDKLLLFRNRLDEEKDSGDLLRKEIYDFDHYLAEDEQSGSHMFFVFKRIDLLDVSNVKMKNKRFNKETHHRIKDGVDNKDRYLIMSEINRVGKSRYFYYLYVDYLLDDATLLEQYKGGKMEIAVDFDSVKNSSDILSELAENLSLTK